jgi:hypothetical protein
MSTSQPASNTSTPRQRGHMYLRAEQRHREELAETGLASVLTPVTERAHQPRPQAPLADAIGIIAGGPPARVDPGSPAVVTSVVNPAPVVDPVVPPVSTALPPAGVPSRLEAPTLPIPPSVAASTSSSRVPAARSTRRRTTLIPAAALGGVAVAAMLGVTLLLTAGGERQDFAPVEAAGPPPSTPASAAPVSSAVAGARPQPTATAAPAASTRSSVSVSGPVAAARPVQPAAAAARPAPPVVRTARAATAATVASPPQAIEGQLRITSTPAGARVTIDGIGWGQTPITVGHLTFGSRTVRVTHDGYTAHQAVVTLSAGAPTQAVNLTLRKR